MQADQLFLRTLEDLDRRTTVADEYEALLAAGLLRKLLLDEAPLVHQVNRYRRETNPLSYQRRDAAGKNHLG